MNERTRASLDHFITGSRYRKWAEEIECKYCDTKWEARFESEYGMITCIDDDNLCPRCGLDYDEQ